MRYMYLGRLSAFARQYSLVVAKMIQKSVDENAHIAQSKDESSQRYEALMVKVKGP